ncbi:MAG: site-specific tyrosine recombinase XerD [Chthoniobacterales bacterium]
MHEVLETFLLYLATERGLSTNYQLSTRSSLERFFSWLEQHSAITELGNVRTQHLHDFLQSEKKRGLASTSLKLEVVALRIFFRFLTARKILSSDPAEKLPLPKLPHTLPQPLAPAAIQKLLSASQGQTPLEVRDRALLELLYACGLRISELCTVRLENIDLQEGMIRVTGKGNKTRLVPVGQAAITAIEEYLSLARPNLLSPKSGAALFLSVRGHPLTAARIWQLVSHYAKQAGLEEAIHPHQLRHSFATHLLAGGADLRIIQEMLGHASIATTQIYTQVDQSQLKAVHQKFHPRG